MASFNRVAIVYIPMTITISNRVELYTRIVNVVHLFRKRLLYVVLFDRLMKGTGTRLRAGSRRLGVKDDDNCACLSSKL